MENFEKILEYIKSQSESECREIAVKANEESDRIRAKYSQREQDAYEAAINEGSKDIEKRVEKLATLASGEANKKVHALEQSMLDEVLTLTAYKLSTLSAEQYDKLLNKLGVESGCPPEYLVEQYRDELETTVINALFA